MDKKQVSDTFTVILDADVREHAKGFDCIDDCFIATAVKRQYDVVKAAVDPDSVTVDGVEYDIVGQNGYCVIVEHAVAEEMDLAVTLVRQV